MIQKDIKPYILVVLILLSLGACEKIRLDEIDNLVGRIRVIGHGGAGFQSFVNPYPTNSWLSIKNAIEHQNADGVEVDVQISKDGVLVLYHDDKLESLTNCIGCVSDKSYATLTECEYNRNFNNNIFLSEKILSMDALLKRYAAFDPHPYIYLDIKTKFVCGPEAPFELDSFAAIILDGIKKYSAWDWVVVESGSFELLKLLRAANSQVTLMFDTDELQGNIALMRQEKMNGFVIRNNNVTKEEIAEAHRNGLEVHLFGVKTRSGTKEAVQKYPDGIQTDNLILLQEFLRE